MWDIGKKGGEEADERAETMRCKVMAGVGKDEVDGVGDDCAVCSSALACGIRWLPTEEDVRSSDPDHAKYRILAPTPPLLLTCIAQALESADNNATTELKFRIDFVKDTSSSEEPKAYCG